MAKSKKNTKKPLVIDDETPHTDHCFDWKGPDGERRGRGYAPRGTYPPNPEWDTPDAMFDPPDTMTEIPQSEWSARVKQAVQDGTRLSDVRNRGDNGKVIKSLDQNGQSFCWAYSGGSAITVVRALNHMPYVRLSPHAVACKIKNFRDEGGWCGLSAKFAREQGYPSVATWPEKSMGRQYDTEATWADAAKHKVTEDWVEVTKAVYDQNLKFSQVVSCLLSGTPCQVDFNWWSHSVCALDVVEVEPGSFGLLIWNSWGDVWSDNGTGILRGSKAVPDGATALRVAS